MNAQKQKAVDYARSLFCEVSEDGSKKYSLHEIAKQLQQKCKYSVNVSNLSRWSKKFDWEDTFTKLKQAGIEQAKGDIDNKIIDEKAQTIADIYKGNKQIQNLAKQTILARLLAKPVKDNEGNEIKSDVTNADIIRLLQHSETTILILQDKGKSGKDVGLNTENTIVVFK
jgi:hypothetical protein